MIEKFIETNAARAVSALAIEAANTAAREANKGNNVDAWDTASTIGNAAMTAATTFAARAAIFGVASKYASEAFIAARTAHLRSVAEKSPDGLDVKTFADAEKWGAFASACSVARGALELGVYVVGASKGATAKALKAQRDAGDAAAVAAAIAAGMLPGLSGSELENLRAAVARLTVERDMVTSENVTLRESNAALVRGAEKAKSGKLHAKA